MNNNMNNISDRLKLKALKTCAFMSEETNCFTATVLLDGKVIGEAQNDGHGGSTFIHFVDDDVRDKADAFAKTISPLSMPGWEFLGDKGFSVETLVDILVEQDINRKASDKLVKKMRKLGVDKLAYIHTDDPHGRYWVTSHVTPDNSERLKDRIKTRPKFKALVSDMTDAEILAHFG